MYVEQHNKMAIVLLLLLAELHLFGKSLAHPTLRVYIDGSEGKDSLECLNSNSNVTPCQSLSFVSENLTQKYFVHIEILGDLLNLTRAVNFTDYSHLNISGSGRYTTVYCNESDAGLAFIRVKNLSVHFLSVENCGALRPSTTSQKYLPVAIYILNCTDVSFYGVNIVSSNGTGLSVYDTNGAVDIMHCNFINNSVFNHNTSGGSGLYIEFTVCSPGFKTKYEYHSQRNSNSTYNINNCNFRLNSAISSQPTRKLIPPSQPSSVPRLGKGGGLYISIGLDAENNTFLISSCTFVKNSATYDGGGMVAEFLTSVKRNAVSVVHTSFKENSCMQTQFSGTGGLVLGFMFYFQSQLKGKQPQNNTFGCQFCLFHRNQGHMGGGTALYATKGGNQSSLSTILFSNCNWTENESAMGAAVFITPGIWDYTKEGYLPIPMFTDCRFVSNSAIQTLKPPVAEGIGVTIESVGYGAVFVSEMHVIFQGSTHFCDNSGSAVHLSSSVMEFKSESNVKFYNNTSQNGSAIAMYSSSMIRVENSSTFRFFGNKADSHGGAVYVDVNAATHPAYHNCFISSSDLSPVNSTFVFRENFANASGDSIFTATFQSCALLCSNFKMSRTPEDIMQCIANFTFDETNLSLSTRPERFKLSQTSPVKLFPGEEYFLNLTASDEAENNLSNVVYEASVKSPYVVVDPVFRQVSNNTIMVKGLSGLTATMKLFTADVLVSFNITLTECQPGYHYNPNTSKCECASSEYLGLEGCDPSVYIKEGYWMGYCSNNGSELCTALCPYGFCSYTRMDPVAEKHELNGNSNVLDSDICGPSRTNRLCGECSTGHSIYHNSLKRTCGSEKLCHLGWLFYILSDILPLTLLFIVALVLNISFTNGNTNCFVLYGQLLTSLSFIDTVQFSRAAQLIQDIVTFPYNSFDLNFFYLESLSFCLWKGATFMEAMMMNYLTVLFALLLVLLTIYFTKHHYVRTKMSFRYNHQNSVLIHGLSAFFILCYSQAVRTNFHILNPACLYSTNYNCIVKVVHQAGNLMYLEGEHVPYAIVAILVLIFMIIIPPLLLLVYPLMFKLFGLCNLSETKLVTILWRMMPIQFLDAFQSSFKDKYRFFAGLYFLYRAIILTLYMWCQSWLEFYSAVQLLLTIILTVHSVLQPHKERKHNIVDSLLFANLCLINAIALYYYSRVESLDGFKSEVMVNALAIVQAVLIILPLLLVITLNIIELRKCRRKQWDYEGLPSLRSDNDDSSEEGS